MEHVRLPGTEEQISKVTLGTWAIGGWMWGGTDEKTSIKTIHAALDKGVNCIDTAPVYGFGASESIVGKALAEYPGRGAVHISTKCSLQWSDDGQVTRNASRQRIMQEVEDSLQRLGVDAIDIYFIHWPDESVPVEETTGAMVDLLRQGKIKSVGVSNYSTQQMDAFRKYCPLHCAQPPYNIFERDIEKDVLPYCKHHGVLSVTYGALCRGLLSGRMSKDREFTGDDLRKSDPKFQGQRFAQYLAAAERLKNLARERYDKDLLPFAVRWVLDSTGGVALWGAREPGQMDPLDEVMGWSLDPAGMRAVDDILAETVLDPVGPEFMAPPESGS